jgi:hypothetical protein
LERWLSIATALFTIRSLHVCRQVYPGDKEQAERIDAQERAAFTTILSQFGADMLPHGLPADVIDIVAPSVMYPDQIDTVLGLIGEHAPLTFDLAVCCFLPALMELWPAVLSVCKEWPIPHVGPGHGPALLVWLGTAHQREDHILTSAG